MNRNTMTLILLLFCVILAGHIIRGQKNNNADLTQVGMQIGWNTESFGSLRRQFELKDAVAFLVNVRSDLAHSEANMIRIGDLSLPGARDRLPPGVCSPSVTRFIFQHCIKLNSCRVVKRVGFG